MNYSRVSRYMPGGDGTLLAVDLYLPDTEEKVPVLMNAGYEQRRERFEHQKDYYEQFLNAGYALAIVDVRGSGASYGVSDGFFGRHDGKDLACILKQLTKEDWSNGKAGTFGGSNYGMSQEITLLEQPECLKAAIPADCSMDLYDQNYPNGASCLPEFEFSPNSGDAPTGTPVDEDDTEEHPLLTEALKSRSRNLPFLGQFYKNMWRDDIHPYLGYRPNIEIPAWQRMEDVRHGHSEVWSTGAWFDPGCTNKILTWKSWGGKLLLGPWPHCGIYSGNALGYPNASYDWIKEHIRFFDHHLKDLDNNIDQEPPILYYTVNEEDGREWKYEADFPVEGTLYSTLHLNADHSLTEHVSDNSTCNYTVRNDVKIYEKFGRMNRNITKDMQSEDAKSVCFTSQPLSAPLELTGIPILELYATSTHTDGNFIAVLEHVSPDGTSHFITEGAIRASHAKVQRNAVYDSLGLPYHRSYREDEVSLSTDTPLKLAFHLEAVSRVIPAGDRLRISVSCGGSGYNQPDGFPLEMPTVTFHCGKDYDAKVILPVIKPWKTRFTDGETTLYVFKRAVYVEKNGHFTAYPCTQVYPSAPFTTVYETCDFSVTVSTSSDTITAEAESRLFSFHSAEPLPLRQTFAESTMEIPVQVRRTLPNQYEVIRDLYVASVPVSKGVKGNINPMQRSTFDLFIDLAYPQEEKKALPCVVNIHGFGGNHHEFDSTAEKFLEKGIAVASIDYRLTPPETWESPCLDAHACIRYLKAHAEELGLDPNRFAVIGGSMGGYLTSMMAAVNGDPTMEGTIGGNTMVDSGVNVGAAYFAPTDLIHFGDDASEVWPGQPDKVANADGPFAPIASMLGYLGYGKGIGQLKAHQFDPDPTYRNLLQELYKASPINHVSEQSAPLALVHGVYDCGIQVPMGQSTRMFMAYTRKGVKSLLLCNNNGFFGEDPEVKDAVVRFIADRI